ncbi:hypothetical protein AB6A40_003917 [Gnathostoma spinigerum]|uniref:Huntingtin interacting protein 1 n=1 Tax=Gnathostoma spinigerum TaxID=75299 RepID=A0ABD6EB44_9BILA
MSWKVSSTGVSREVFAKQQIISVHKALTKVELPVKQKHVRILIVGTHKEKSAALFWNTISHIELEKNPVVSWKFCHVLHKLIRDGHRKVLDDSYRYTKRIDQLGKFWKHLKTSGYGSANTSYCTMLVSRLEFHKNNPIFPGSLELTESQVNTLINGDIDQVFEVSTELLDQMDNLINLQTTVFETMDVVRWSSVIPQGQCLLAPLILVIVDLSKLYDYLVKMIFRLHEVVPPDTLAGHRERFDSIFIKMKKFYEEASALQYFKYLVSVPTLPAESPDFLQASYMETYQSPQAYLHGDNISESETPPDYNSVIDENLVDVSDETAVGASSADYFQHVPEIIQEKDEVIENLRHEKEQMMMEARSRMEEYQNKLQQMQHENDQLKQKIDELKEENQRNCDIIQNIQNEKSAAAEEQMLELKKQAATDKANFDKMKMAYADVRQVHLEALKKLSNVEKSLSEKEKLCTDSEDALRELKEKIHQYENEKSVMQEEAEKSKNLAEDLGNQLTHFQIEIENLKKNLEEEKNLSKSSEEEKVEKIHRLEEELLESKKNEAKAEEAMNCLKEENDTLKKKIEESQTEINALNETVSQMEKSQLAEKSEYRKSLDKHVAEIDNLVCELDAAKNALSVESHSKEYLLKKLEEERNEANKKEKAAMETQRSTVAELRWRLFAASCEAVCEMLKQAKVEIQSTTSMTFPPQVAFSMLHVVIENCDNVASLIKEEPNGDLLHTVVIFGHILSDTVVFVAAGAYTQSIQYFEPIHKQGALVADTTVKTFTILSEKNFEAARMEYFPKLKKELEKLEDMCLKLPASTDLSMEEIDSQLEQEMKRMDSAIKNAVAKIEKMQELTREKDTGVRLEVNAKILDSCNALMAAIIVLVGKSRAMQEEIVSLGRGTASPREFYKRNHLWTEGLLSAAKAVGVAATVLVQCADEVVTKEGKLERLIVAAQEISASTAQLFVSSRVKADRESEQLAELASASHRVNSCTANVVATVKAGQESLNDTQALDFTHLTLHEAKKEEMESQVRLLGLEAELNRERSRLAELRRRHFHEASVVRSEDNGS